MAETKTFVANAPVWVDLSSTDAAASRDYYAKLFGWKVELAKDPAAGGYALATIGGKNVAGIGPTQQPNTPSAWMVYIGTRDADATAKKVEAAGGKVIAAPFDVLKSGRMAVFQDPAGAFISAWQPNEMQGADIMNAPGSFSWSELNARGIDKAKSFYKKVFGWGEKQMPMGEGVQGEYTEFKLNDESIAGGMEMNPMVPKEVRPTGRSISGSKTSTRRTRRQSSWVRSRCSSHRTFRADVSRSFRTRKAPPSVYSG